MINRHLLLLQKRSIGLINKNWIKKNASTAAANKKFAKKEIAESSLSSKALKSTNNNNTVFKCVYCDFTETTTAKLKTHLSTVHKMQPYPCTHCDVSFKTFKEFTNHLKKQHPNVKVPKSATELFSVKSLKETKLVKPETVIKDAQKEIKGKTVLIKEGLTKELYIKPKSPKRLIPVNAMLNYNKSDYSVYPLKEAFYNYAYYEANPPIDYVTPIIEEVDQVQRMAFLQISPSMDLYPLKNPKYLIEQDSKNNYSTMISSSKGFQKYEKLIKEYWEIITPKIVALHGELSALMISYGNSLISHSQLMLKAAFDRFGKK